MAVVQLKDVEVTRVNAKGNGVQVTESSESGGRTFRQKFTVWFDAPSGLQTGDFVSLSGFLGAKVSEPWKDREGNERVSVELSVNSPRISGGAEKVAVKVAAPPAGWDATGSEIPF